MNLAGLWRFAVGQIGAGTGGKLRQQRHCPLPLPGDDLADRKAFTSIVDGWFKHVSEGEFTVPALHLHEGIDRARHGH